MRKRVLSMVLVLCMMLSLLPWTVPMASASETVGSRDIGINAKWDLMFDGGNYKIYSYSHTPEYSDVRLWFVPETGTISGAAFGPSQFGAPDETYHLTIPKTLGGVDVTKVSSLCYDVATSKINLLSSLTVPNSVQSLGGCNDAINLTSVTFLGPIELVANAFTSCTSLENVTWKYITSIGGAAFSGCSSLKHVDLPEGIILDDSVFSQCKSLTNVTLPSSLTVIPSSTFEGSGLSSIILNNGCTSISSMAFASCKNLTNVKLNNGLIEIGSFAFDGCSNLINVDIPSSVDVIGDGAFMECSKLINVTLPKRDNLRIGEKAFQNSGLISIIIPTYTTSIGGYCFSGCDKMTWVSLPNPNNRVFMVVYAAFDGCSALTDVYFDGSQEEWSLIRIFDDNDPLKNATIHYNSTGPENPIDPVGKLNLSVTVNTPDSLLSADSIPIDVKVEVKDVQFAETLTVLLDTSSSNGYLTIQNINGNVTESTQDTSIIPTSYFAFQPKWYVDADIHSANLDKKICFEVSVYRNYHTQNKELLFNQNYSILNTIDPTDTDGDGLPDVWELYGVDTNNDGIVDLPIHEWGADPNKPDIFIEVDWMNKPSPGKLSFSNERGGSLAPTKAQLQTVYDAFKNHDINIHIDAGSNSVGFESVQNWASYSGSNEIPYTKVFYVGTESTGYQEWHTLVDQNFARERLPVFRHCMFVNQYTQESSQVNHPWSESCKSSGIADNIPGQCFIVANQGLGVNVEDVTVSGTFMHELGHTLGLKHGGQDHENYKPNYLSIMNYSFQLQGLNPTKEINYSDYKLNDIDENAIDEFNPLDSNLLTPTGLITTWYVYDSANKIYIKKSYDIAFPINWNLNADANGNPVQDSPYKMNINKEDVNGKQTFTVLKSYTDWDKLIYKGGSIGDVSKASTSTSFDVYTESELTLQEAIRSDLIDEPGVGRVHFSGPFTLIYTSNDQKLFFDVENYRLQDEDFLLIVNESSLTNREEIPVHAVAATELQSSTRIEIPVKYGLAVGTYPLEYSLINTSTGNTVYNESTTVEVYYPTADEISEFLNNPPAENVDPDLQKQLTHILNNLQVSNPSKPSNPGSSSSSSSGDNDPSYSISVPSGLTGGKISVTPTRASAGQRVTITVTPDKDYELDSLTVIDSKGNELVLTDKGAGKYTFNMPTGKVTINATFKASQPFASIWNNPFVDVAENAWYYDAVRFVNQQGLMNGTSSNTFSPDSKLTRAQLAQVLYNKNGRPYVNSTSTFTDVVADAWYADAITWATSKGIISGYGNGMVGPNDFITREQLATILWRYENSPISNYELQFTDTDHISQYALNALRWAAENGIMNGYSDGRLAPSDNANRSHVAQMLKNCFSK